MLVQCIGVAKLDFTPAEGRPVKGWTVYYTYKAVGVEGEAADKVFISEDTVTQSCPGRVPMAPSRINLDFDKKGKLVALDLDIL